MRMEQPGAADLLAIARTTLLDEIVPQLSGDVRFKALMVANAMAIAERAIMTESTPEQFDIVTICAKIRAGIHDDDPEMAARLLADAEARCRISSKPDQQK